MSIENALLRGHFWSSNLLTLQTFSMLDGEEKLITSAVKGNSSAFGALYDHYQPMIYRFVAVKVGRREEAEDITHQVFCPRGRISGRTSTAGIRSQVGSTRSRGTRLSTSTAQTRNGAKRASTRPIPNISPRSPSPRPPSSRSDRSSRWKPSAARSAN